MRRKSLLSRQRLHTKHVVAAYNFDRFRYWCRTHEIDPRAVSYVSGPEKLLGLGAYHVVLLNDYHRHPVFRDDSDHLLFLKYALDTHYEWDIPLVEAGKIVGWQ